MLWVHSSCAAKQLHFHVDFKKTTNEHAAVEKHTVLQQLYWKILWKFLSQYVTGHLSAPYLKRILLSYSNADSRGMGEYCWEQNEARTAQ